MTEQHNVQRTAAQRPTAETRWAAELEHLAANDSGPKPPGWRLSPRAVVDFICGTDGSADADGGGGVTTKFVGDRKLVERCVVTLAGARGLLLVGEPGTAKSMLSELLSAAISGTSELTVQGSAGTTEDQLRYGWNYGMLLADGPTEDALVPSPVMTAMRTGRVVRIEEITRCLPEIQDAIVPLLSERRLAVPELDGYSVEAAPGFCVIGTANLRDRGVSEMSAALKRRFSFEQVDPIADRDAEIELVLTQTRAVLDSAGLPDESLDLPVVDSLVTVMRDLRNGRTEEGWAVERPATVTSTAETVAIAGSVALSAAYFPLPDGGNGSGNGAGAAALLPGHLLGAVRKDDSKDQAKLAAYWDAVVRRRAQTGDADGTDSDDSASDTATWRLMWDHRGDLRP